MLGFYSCENENTVDMVLQDLMERGIKVEGGDLIGKTIIFAQNKKHAEFILDRFNKLTQYDKAEIEAIKQMLFDKEAIENYVVNYKDNLLLLNLILHLLKILIFHNYFLLYVH